MGLMLIDDLEIERAIISDFIYYGNDEPETVAKYTEDDFSVISEKKILKAIKTLISKEKPFDKVLIIDELKHYKLTADEQTDIANIFLNEPISRELFQAHLLAFDKIIETRKIKNILGNSDEKTADKIIDELQAVSISRTTNVESETKANIDNYISKTLNPPEHIKTYFGSIDKLLNGGFQKGTLAIIGARPRVGKTAFACSILANHLSKGNNKIMFFSLEMTSKQILDRLISNQMSVNYGDIVRGVLNAESKEKVKAGINAIKEANKNKRIYVSNSVNRVEDICVEIKKHSPDLVFIDYATIIDTEQKFKDIREKVDYVVNKLKSVALNTQAVVILLAQLNRNSEKDTVRLADLKESGHIEEAGDYIFLIDRTLEDSGTLENQALVKLAKTNSVKADFYRSILTANINGLPKIYQISEAASYNKLLSCQPQTLHKGRTASQRERSKRWYCIRQKKTEAEILQQSDNIFG